MDDFQNPLFLAEERSAITLAKKKQHEHAKLCRIETFDQSIEHSNFASVSAPSIKQLSNNVLLPSTPPLDGHPIHVAIHVEDDIDVFFCEENEETVDLIGSDSIDTSN